MLTDAGKESFPRNYSWLAQLLIESLKEQDGAEGLRERLRALGSAVARQLRDQHPGLQSRQQKVEKLSQINHAVSRSATYFAAASASRHRQISARRAARATRGLSANSTADNTVSARSPPWNRGEKPLCGR